MSRIRAYLAASLADLTTNGLVLAGLGLFSAGFWLMWEPLGYVVGGLCCLVLAWVVGGKGRA